MMIVMNTEATQEQIHAVIVRVEANGFKAHPVIGVERSVIAVVGNNPINAREQFLYMPGIEQILPISRPFKVASREFIPTNSSFALDGIQIGGDEVVIIAGPCAVESRNQMLEIAQAIKEAGGQALRGGAFKPRSSPYSFQGLGEEGLEILAEAREKTGLPIITEVMSPEAVPLVAKYADALQIGARNMQNFSLLHAAGESQHPVLLKRGNAATIEELLMAAEYILSHGNRRVILCERGIRTFETETRYTLDLGTLAWIKLETHLPVISDPSHATGNHRLVPQMALASIAAGADGLMIEVHPHPDKARSDGPQSLTPKNFARLMDDVRRIAAVVGKQV